MRILLNFGSRTICEAIENINQINKQLGLFPKETYGIEDYSALVDRAYSWASLAQFAKAQTDIEAAEKTDPDNYRAYFIDALIHHKMRLTEGQKNICNDVLYKINMAIDLIGDKPQEIHSDVFCFRGVLHMIIEAHDLAERDLSLAIQLNSKNSIAAYDLGCIHQLKGESHNLDSALIYFTMAIDCQEEFSLAESYTQRANIYIERGLYPLAIADIDEALKIEDRNPNLYYSKAGCLTAIELYDQAFTNSIVSLQLSNNQIPLFHELHIEILAKLGLMDFAVKHRQVANQLKKRDIFNRSAQKLSEKSYDSEEELETEIAQQLQGQIIEALQKNFPTEEIDEDNYQIVLDEITNDNGENIMRIRVSE